MTGKTPAMTEAELTRLLALLERQLSLYQDLAGLSQEQAPLVAQGETDALLRLLGRREQCIGSLRQVNTELEPFRLRWIEWLPALTQDQKAHIAGMTDRIKSLRDQIVQQDERDCQSLRRERERVSAQMSRQQYAGSAARAYRGGAPARANVMTDQRG